MLTLLVATAETQDAEGDVDFDEGVSPGELVEPAFLCDRDRLMQWPGGCGCGRSFVGFASDKRTTTARVAEVDMTIDELRSLLADRHPEADGESLAEMAADLIENGQQFPLGTVCRIWRYQVELRDATDLGAEASADLHNHAPTDGSA